MRSPSQYSVSPSNMETSLPFFTATTLYMAQDFVTQPIAHSSGMLQKGVSTSTGFFRRTAAEAAICECGARVLGKDSVRERTPEHGREQLCRAAGEARWGGPVMGEDLEGMGRAGQGVWRAGEGLYLAPQHVQTHFHLRARPIQRVSTPSRPS